MKEVRPELAFEGLQEREKYLLATKEKKVHG